MENSSVDNSEIVKIRSVCNLPLMCGRSEKKLYTFNGLSAEHVAIVFGQVDQVPYVRIHSECLTGDVFGSLRCDCGEQLTDSLNMFEKKGGILVYLRQEGRGIGLYNKIDAYLLQEKGLNTYEANNHLGFLPDMRDYRDAALILRLLKVQKIKLITNNQDKIDKLKLYGIELERVPSTIHVNDYNRHYMRDKMNYEKLRQIEII